MAETGTSPPTLSIEEAEFQRLQTQLIELRTTNYQLKEQQAKSSAEAARLQDVLQSQARELDKANKTIQRSKKAKEFSALFEENDGLQRKLETQEEDFRLQNRTLMEELSKVCDEKDHLMSDLERLQAGSLTRGTAGEQGGELTHLQAENIALQKSLQALQEKLQDSSSIDGEEQQTSVASSNARVLELEVKLATEEEEKRILKQRLEEIQDVARRQQADLQSELEKWTEKAKKKQDSLVHLQEEKERYFHESRASFDEMVRSKDHEIHGLQDQILSLKRDMEAKNEVSVTREEIAKQLGSLSTEKEELHLRCTTLLQEKEALVSELADLKVLLDELGRELQQSKADLGEERKENRDLRTQLEEAKLSQEQLADQVVKTSEEKYNLLKELDTAKKLAEKRKLMVDEMVIKGQVSATEQMKKFDDIQESHMEDIARLEEELQAERSRLRKLTEMSEELPELKQRLKVLEEEEQSYEARTRELEARLAEEKSSHESTLARVQSEWEEQTQSLQSELDLSHEEVQQWKGRACELEQVVTDREEEVKIVEKKSQSLLKDLKRQLQQMHKREERYQEQLAEMRGGQALDPLFSSPAPPNRELSHDSMSRHSRDSSLSSLRGLGNTDNTTLTSITTPSPSASMTGTLQLQVATQPSTVSEETQELLTRVAELQQEKWALEERVNHLETTGSALAEDVVQKSEIIKSYFMKTKADHYPPQRRSMVDKMSPLRWGRGKEETLSEINRKMQRALEETLMKNIHLQENVEMLTTELEKKPSPDKSTEQGKSSEPNPTAEANISD